MICGTPTPATMRVVQIDPGPIPTFTPSAPWSTSARAPSPVPTLPPITCDLRVALLDPLHPVQHALRVPVGGVHHEQVGAGLDQGRDALVGALAHADRGAHAQLALGVLARARMLAFP